jgi:S-(hydroxymethyl)glutathione dehydrogenase/alcohol dehydrogenase
LIALTKAFHYAGAVRQFAVLAHFPFAFMDVRAAVAARAGQAAGSHDRQLDGPRAGEVLVEIKATGICHTDEFTLSGADPEGLFPAILGHEGAGIVVDIGRGVTR